MAIASDQRPLCPTSVRGPRMISNACLNPCATSHQGQPARQKSRMHWCGSPPKQTIVLRSAKAWAHDRQIHDRRSGCPVDRRYPERLLSGGSLAVPRGDEVVPLINGLAGKFAHVVLTQDWHP